jgi:hypothetical protein
MSTYPEHDKLAAVKDDTQAAGTFVEWLGTQGVFLAKTYMFDADDCVTEDEAEKCYERTFPVTKSLVTLLAEWTGVDQDRLEAEKRAMLAAIRTTAEG